MNKIDKMNAEFLRNKLAPLDEKITSPDELSAENIAELVNGEKQKKSKRGKIIVFRTIGSIAAAIILAIGIGTGVYFYNRPGVTVMPDDIANAQIPISNNTEQTFIDYFTALRAEYEKDEIHYLIDEGFDFGLKAEDEAMPEGGVMNGSAATDTSGTVSHGTTNTQIKDIDEDDIIKNDGRYIYVLTDSSIKIIDAANMKLMSKVNIESRGSNGLYLYGNTLVAVGSTFDKKQQTVIEIYDITDKTKPKLKNEFSQD
ncbi:MAG: beta-propeller domain-containing protein, partial [Clostridia bacterium]|nr:beta-propeller domain-containing protein [Clostridia bacterium]